MKSLYFSKRCLPTGKALLFLFFLLGSFVQAQAQVSFTSPAYPGVGAASEFTVYNSPVDDGNNAVKVQAPGDGDLTVNFSATLFRPAGTSTQGFVAVQLGTSPSNLVTPELTAAAHPTVDNSLWTAVQNTGSTPTEQLVVTGTFTISGSVAGNNTGFYAVYYSNNGASPVVSHPVLLRVLPPDPIKNPLLFYIRCSNNVICDDQCVPYGAKPAVIKGRVLASYNELVFQDGSWHSRYEDYAAICAQKGISTWASQSENEEVIWQYSYDNSNWSNVDNYNNYKYSSSFQPPACTRTTYYRRLSSHLERNWWTGNSQEGWYDSNVVRITPTAPVPTTNQSNVKSCGGSVTVSANTHLGISSYNWWVPYAGWTISDGTQAPFSTFYNNGSFITSRNAGIVIYPPSNAAPGNYVISFSANGECGDKSADAQLTVTIDYSGTSAPTNGYFTLAGGSTSCAPRYNLRTSPVSGATSYEATLSTGAWAQGQLNPNTGEISFFIIPGRQYNISAQIFAVGPCGRSVAYDVPAQDLNLRQQDAESLRPCDETPVEEYIKAYPNPTNESLTIKAQNDGSVGYLYNSQGTAIRTIQLDKSSVSKAVDTSNLPNGLYNLVIESPNHERHVEHIFIEH
ncbi:MAG: T9SS type A sorting domain-containing protein [Janthinobacterium lividum]